MAERTPLNTEEAARRLRLSVVTLEKWRARRFGPPFGRAGRRVFYFADDIQRWLEDQVQFPAR